MSTPFTSPAPANPPRRGPTTALPVSPDQPTPAGTAGTAGTPGTPGRKKRRWIWPAAAIGALLVGVGIGAAGGGGDLESSPEYQEAIAKVTELRDAVEVAEERADDAVTAATAAESALDTREAELDTRDGELQARAVGLDTRQADLEAREVAVGTAEAAVVANQIDIGTWTVGVDIAPGTYRTAEAVASTCYWGIYRSGSNGSDIIENDLVQGGFPTVTLSEGQDFENGCGIWNKQ